LRHIRFSDFAEASGNSYDVLIMDRIGLLSSLYYYGYINYVGGSFSEGLHNILEPAVYGAPVLIGKDKTNKKYREATSMIEERGAFEIRDPDELENVMNNLSKHPAFYREVSVAAQGYVKSNLGASRKIGSAIMSMLKRNDARRGI
jgi:3-deoxy-D-manno-octulosonic-acid transferase